MAVDGTYNIEVQTPMGVQPGKITLKSEGKSLSGKFSSEMGEQDIKNGSVTGDTFTFPASVTTPMGDMALEFTGTVSGNTVSGQVKTGSFGFSPFKGTKI